MVIWPLFVVACLVVSYVVILNSEGYALATRFVEQNDEIRANIGAVRSQRLGIRYLRFGFSGTYDELQFSVHVTGERDNANVIFELARPKEIWQINSAMLRTDSGKEVQLYPSLR